MEGVREAEAADLPVLLALYESLKLELGEYRGRWYELDAWPEPADESFRAAMADPATLVLVGTIDGFPLGYAVCEVRPGLPQNREGEVGRIRHLFVEVQAREVGVGEALVSACIAWMRGRGVRSADLQVLPGHRAAKNFCEENGFVARSLTMHARW